MRPNRSDRILAARALVLIGLVCVPRLVTAAASDAARAELKGYLENVTAAAGWRYGARDSAGNTMDTAKIVADPAGGFLAVYHTFIGGTGVVKLARSTDLLNWTYHRDLRSGAHQPTIRF